MDVDPLAVDPETMRRLGHLVVDRLADRAAARREEPVLRRASPAEMARRVPGVVPISSGAGGARAVDTSRTGPRWDTYRG